MRIGIDIDNVIADTFKDLSEAFNSYMGKQLKPQEVVDIMRKERLRMWGYWFITWKKRLLTKVAPVKGAKEALEIWFREHDILLVTSRLPILRRQTRQWLEQHGIPYHELHHLKEGRKFKKGKGCDIFIEDNLEECEILADHVDRVFLIDQPWNRRETKKKNIVRVGNWSDVRI